VIQVKESIASKFTSIIDQLQRLFYTSPAPMRIEPLSPSSSGDTLSEVESYHYSIAERAGQLVIYYGYIDGRNGSHKEGMMMSQPSAGTEPAILRMVAALCAHIYRTICITMIATACFTSASLRNMVQCL
jgi:hypothetical protein